MLVPLKLQIHIVLLRVIAKMCVFGEQGVDPLMECVVKDQGTHVPLLAVK